MLKALCGFHKDCGEIPKNSTSFHGPYANIDDINTIINPLLSKHGLFITHEPHDDNFITTRVFHTSGGYLESIYPVFIKRSNDSQAWGSAITYAKRYATVAMLNLVVGDPDDDGNRQKNNANKPQKKKPTNQPNQPYQKKPSPKRRTKDQLEQMIKTEAKKVASESEAHMKKIEGLRKYQPKPLCPRPEWEDMKRVWDDKTRVRFMSLLPKDITYNQLKNALYARGFKKPSSMDREKRLKLMELIHSEGLDVIDRIVPDAAK